MVEQAAAKSMAFQEEAARLRAIVESFKINDELDDLFDPAPARAPAPSPAPMSARLPRRGGPALGVR